MEALTAFAAAAAIATTGTVVGLAAASLGDRGADDQPGIQLVRPFHVSPEIDRANHDRANH